MAMYIKDVDFLIAFGKNLKQIRKGRSLTIEQLADEANISYSQISRIETARINPTICTVRAISKALSLPMSELLDFELVESPSVKFK